MGTYIHGSKLCNAFGGVFVVASSTYEGDYTLKCDGTDDDVEIQSALDKVELLGGGTIRLTNGTFNLTDKIDVAGAMILEGSGATILSFDHDGAFVRIDGASTVVRNLAITAVTSGATLETGVYLYATADNCIISNVQIYGLSALALTKGIDSIASSFLTRVENCYLHDFEVTSTPQANKCVGIVGCVGVTSCQVDGMVNSLGAYATTGIYGCTKCQQNRSVNSTTPYGAPGAGQSYADAGTANACADTAAGGYNS